MPSSLVGSGLLAEYQDLNTTSTTSGGMQLGSKAVTGDGREFRFVLAGAVSLVPGKLQQSSVENTGWENLAVAAAAIGATTITTTTTLTVTANAWAGGSLMVTTSTGVGYQYRIKSNPAATSAAVTITLDDPLVVALTTGSRIDVIASVFNGVIVNPTTATGAIVGAATFIVTNAQYGWIQTKGTANVLADGTVVVGEEVGASAAIAGAVKATAGVVSDVGYAITGIADTEYGSVFLNIS